MTRPSGIDRISSNDLTMLATDRGPVPMNIAAILTFDAASAPSFPELAAALRDRVPRVARLRQRLTPVPLGSGRPVWVDDPAFGLSRHLIETRLPDDAADGDEALLHAAAGIACQRLPRDRPPWVAHWVHGGPGRPAALVFVAHHVMADGLGGLAVLAALGDGGGESSHVRTDFRGPGPGSADSDAAGHTPFPHPAPTRRDLFADAWREHGSALARLPRALASAVTGLRELGLTSRKPSLAATTSFNRPTGPRRRITTLSLPLQDLLDAAHARGCTLNDLVLSAITGALASALRARGEAPAALVVSVPISSRAGADATSLGNANGVAPVEVPTYPDPDSRLVRVAERTAARRGTSRGASAGPLGLAFRALARAGVFQRFIDRQRLVNTFLSNMRGPAEPLRLAGHRIASIVPLTMTPGNVGVCFAVLSYAGELVVSLLADPEIVAEQDELTRLVAGELAHFTKR